MPEWDSAMLTPTIRTILPTIRIIVKVSNLCLQMELENHWMDFLCFTMDSTRRSISHQFAAISQSFRSNIFDQNMDKPVGFGCSFCSLEPHPYWSCPVRTIRPPVRTIRPLNPAGRNLASETDSILERPLETKPGHSSCMAIARSSKQGNQGNTW